MHKNMPVKKFLTPALERQQAITNERRAFYTQQDYYPAPPEAIFALLNAECETLRPLASIWDPSAGDGSMAAILRRHGYDVYASDLVDRGCGAKIADFYSFQAPLSSRIITKPPVRECTRDLGFVRHALKGLQVDYMALLLPFNLPYTLECGDWGGFPPYKIYMMRWNISFRGKDCPTSYYAWFIWRSGFNRGTWLSDLRKPRILNGITFQHLSRNRKQNDE
ncbi:hypothetical protein N5853_09275 [Bartonella sp. HY329]|uniref:hypothetical protein n=1 Tax=unclassified Bartonella TaxID=2645622 RepID=UPI0021C78C81|nr:MULTISPECIES: hypothetical protein [unclassified Bartonella]UXM94297.1 hypothetical protein N5853_09275 [Bartonella sp. HY329]UXN08620.1 hypothetical protein N5852_09285 [Bartonella sp. HY328]